MSSPAPTALQTAALNYIKWDPNPETRAEIKALLDAKNDKELAARLNSRLAFGTAGLRGPMGGGYDRMNDLVILQTTQGLANYLLRSVGEKAKQAGVVIGYDHRALGSLSSLNFARMSAAVFLRNGFRVYAMEELVPTPLVAFGIKALGCCCGIMVTASHNPKNDNGFKVYWGNGAQLIPPHDTNIANSIQDNLQPWQEEYDTDNVMTHPLTKDVTAEIADQYYAQIINLVSQPTEAQPRAPSLPVAYTAMHGVGRKWLQRAFKEAGLDQDNCLSIVASQAEPDPAFPTVAFPNPEEKGALDQAIAWAGSHGCSLVLANDPDADRLAVAERIGAAEGGREARWRVFTGNEVGTLLGHWQIVRWREANDKDCLPLPGVLDLASIGASLSQTLGLGSVWGSDNSCNPQRPAVLASVVSSRMLRAIAAKENVLYYDTLTGFKWLGNKASQLASSGVPVIFAYEEALGFCCGDIVCDKDGISAAIVLADMANILAALGSSLAQHLESIYAKYGRFVSYNSYVFCHDPALTDAIFARVRQLYCAPGTACCGASVISVKDVTLGKDSASPSGESDLPFTPDSHMIMFEFSNAISITLRTSGTEPKIKFYTEIAGKPAAAGVAKTEPASAGAAGRGGVDAVPGRSDGEVEAQALKSALVTFVDAVVEEMLQPALHKLQRA